MTLQPKTQSQNDLMPCPNCDATGLQKNQFGDAAYLAGYSDHGHATWTTCQLCNGLKQINNQQLMNYLDIDTNF